MKPPLKVWQGALLCLSVAFAIVAGYVVYHIYWGRLAS